jgi:hypothetical protein
MAIKKTRPHFRNHFILATVIALFACTYQVFKIICPAFAYWQYVVSCIAPSTTPLACVVVSIQYHQSDFFPMTAVALTL